MIAGKPWPWLDSAGYALRRYHGYYFSWAVIYTFWYHPIELTLGHLLGTFYVLMLLLQGSLFFTRSHVDRQWTVLLEVFVLIHGSVVAWLSLENHSWGQFLFGFAALFVITQMHGLGWGRRVRWCVFAVFMLTLVAWYRHDLLAGFAEAVRIPLIYLVGVPLLTLMVMGLGRFAQPGSEDSRA